MSHVESKVPVVLTLAYVLAVCLCLSLPSIYRNSEALGLALIALTFPGSLLILTFSERALSYDVPKLFFIVAYALSASINVVVFNWLCRLYRKNNRTITSANN